MKKIIYLTALFSFVVGTAQVRMTGTSISASNSSAFIDASSNPTDNATLSTGKGLVFPRVDLSTFNLLGGSPTIVSNFPTRFDGMIVYNTNNGGIAANGSTQGTLTPGFWFYENKSATVIGGTWKPVTANAGTANNGLTASAGNVQLGGPLTATTTISGLTATNKISFTGTGVDNFNIDSNTLSIDGTNNRVGIGTAAPSAQLHTTGTLLFAGAGTPALGKVLTSDATGNATWQTAKIASVNVDNTTAAVAATVMQTVNTGSIQFTTANTGVIMKSVDGTNWMLTIANNGVITVVKVTP
jgi:hypothetical protein